MDAVERLETTIFTLAWARDHFMEPPQAAKYVTFGMAIFCVLHVFALAPLLRDFAMLDLL